jgi:hypothetical protein
MPASAIKGEWELFVPILLILDFDFQISSVFKVWPASGCRFYPDIRLRLIIA